MSNITKVGIGVAVLKASSFNTQILLGKRKGSHGSGEWAFPGGHLEYMESFHYTAMRELTEEVGPDFKIKNLRVKNVSNLIDYAPKHYIDIGMVAEWVSGDPIVMEPDKVEEWKWFDLWNFHDAYPRFATVDRMCYALGSVEEGVEVYDTNY